MRELSAYKKTKTLFLLLLVFIIPFFSFFLFNYISLQQELREAPPYQDIVVEELRLQNDGDRRYSFRGGEIFQGNKKLGPFFHREKYVRLLRLALFYQWSKENPLLADPRLDAQKFAELTAKLDFNQKEYLSLIVVSDPFLPIEFLKSFALNTQKYQDFLSRPDEAGALELIRSSIASADGYRENALLQKRIIQNAPDQGSFSVGSSSANYKSLILDNLGLTLSNSQELQKEINERKKCLTEAPAYCQRSIMNIEEPEKRKNKKNNTFPILGEDLLDGYLNPDLPINGPFSVKSYCWSRETDQHLLYTQNFCFSPNDCVFYSKLATNNFYRTRFVKFNGQAVEDGLEIQRETSPYTCADNDYKPTLATINYFFANYKNKKIFPEIKKDFENLLSDDLNALIEKSIKAENDFFEENYPSEESLKNLSQYYARTYAQLASQSAEDSDLKKIRDELLQRHVIIEGKLTDFDLVFNFFVKYIEKT